MENKAIAVFAGGCFWCTEAVFSSLKGVYSVLPGYAGGNVPNPSYEQVCGGTTGHAEAIKIEYDPGIIGYGDLLGIFFFTHNPTTLNRQGDDVGTQYRSAIFYADEDQRKAAESFIKNLNESGGLSGRVVTELKPLAEFYPAEDYHKDYYRKNKNQSYCELTISPKLDHLRESYAKFVKK